MRLKLPTIFTALLTTTLVMVPTVAHAAGIADLLGNLVTLSFDAVISIISYATYVVLTVASWFLALCGYLFNASMVFTLNISNIVAETPAIGLVWTTIRNFSSIFFIGMLIYAAIVMILGAEGSGFKKVILNVVIAGLLINFSLFFTKLAIDASNTVSMVFYDAITPGITETGKFTDYVRHNFNDAGISDLFMSSLDLQSVYQSKNQLSKQPNLNTILYNVGGTVLMLIAGFSFLAAAIMFIVRVAILIMLMAFSPLMFIGMVLPQAQEYSKKWVDYLVGQCMFAPVYLMFMYVALRVITSPGFKAVLGTNGQSFTSAFLPGSMGQASGVVIQFVIAVFLLNAGLLAASKFGGYSAEIGNKWKTTIRKNMGSYIGRNTAGRFGTWADEKLANTRSGNSKIGRSMRQFTSGYIANSKYGGDESYAYEKKLSKEVDEKDRKIRLKADLDRALRANNGLGNDDDIKNILNKMSAKEKAELDKKTLSHSAVIRNMSGSIYGQVDKGDRSDKDKQKIKEARKQAFLDTITNGTVLDIAKLTKTLDKDEAADFIESAIEVERNKPGGSNPDIMRVLVKKVKGEHLTDMAQNTINDPDVAEHFTESQLKDMEHLPQAIKAQIGAAIRLRGASANGLSYVNKAENSARWT